MNFILQLLQSLSPYIGLFGFCLIVVFSWLLAGFLTKRKFKRRELGREAAESIGVAIIEVRGRFADKYMPLSLSQQLAVARECQRELLHRSWRIEGEEDLNAIVSEAGAMSLRVFLVSCRTPSVEERQSDRLALIAELAEVEDKAASERAEAEAAHGDELAEIASRLESERARIVKSQAMLEATQL